MMVFLGSHYVLESDVFQMIAARGADYVSASDVFLDMVELSIGV